MGRQPTPVRASALPRGCCVNRSNSHWPSEGGRRCAITSVNEPLLPIAGRHGCHQQLLSRRPIDAPGLDRFVQQPPTAAVVWPRLADGCFSPAMQKPSRSRSAASAALLLLYGIGGPPARSDRAALAVRVIGMRGTQPCRSSEPDEGFRSRTDRPGASASTCRSQAATPAAASLRDERDGRHSTTAPSVAGNMIARRPSGGASAFTAMRRSTIADPCWCSSPPLRPTLRTGMCRVARADPMAIVEPPLLGLDRVADPAPRPHEVVDVAPPGHQPPRRIFQRSPASSPQYAADGVPEPAAHLTAARTKERFSASQVTARGPIVAPRNTSTVPILQQPRFQRIA